MKRLLSLAVLAAVLLAGLTACAPRGETDSLEEILQTSKKRFARALRSGPEEGRAWATDVQPLLEALEQAARNSLDSPSVRVEAQAFEAVAHSLSDLTARAGTPSRAAFGALVAQYEGMRQATTADQAPAANTVKLLVARTYNLLSSELESTAFAL